MEEWQEQLRQQIRDIDGLDAIGWWPPAPGWWYLFAAILISAFLVYFARKQFIAHRNKIFWKSEALFLLQKLEKDHKKTTKEKVAELSILLRRIAIKRYGRDKCAGLEGKDWLKFLRRHDPENFDWEREGRFLVEAPYAPDEKAHHARRFEELLRAAERWVK